MTSWAGRPGTRAVRAATASKAAVAKKRRRTLTGPFFLKSLPPAAFPRGIPPYRSSHTPSCGACPAPAGATQRCPSPCAGALRRVRPLRARRARQRVVLRAPGGALPRTPAPKCRLFFLSASLFCIGTASAFGWLLAYYQIPKAVVKFMAPWATGVTSTGFVIAVIFLIIGCFIDAIPAIIILGPLIEPLARSVGIHPIHFAIIGVVSMAFGLVALALIIMFPGAILALPRFFMPKFV